MKPMIDVKFESYVRSILDGPVLVAETQIEIVVSQMVELTKHENFAELTSKIKATETDEEFWGLEGYRASYRPYSVKNGVLIIPVMGTLIHRFGYQMGNTATGYEYIERAVDRGMADPEVNSILFHIDSPGGQAAGNFELVEHISSLRGQKPMLAMVEDKALSGGYSIATACDEIVSTRSGHTGSVGVVVMHVNFSKALKNFGVEVTFIKAGDRKTDGNPFEELSDKARTRIQQGVDKFYGVFVSTVANNRGMSEDAVRKTEADVYDAEESIDVGFADRIGDFRTELASMEVVQGKGIAMSKETQPEPTIDVAKVEADAKNSERKRYSDVMASEHYEGREKLAQHLLSTTDMKAAEIVSAIAVAEKTVEAPNTNDRNHFEERMAKEGTPGIQPDDVDEPEPESPASVSGTILADYRAAGGRTVQRTN